MFSLQAIHEVRICDTTCMRPDCGYRAIDGSEYFLLRKGLTTSGSLGTFELCFGWDLLYEGVQDLADGGFFFATWVRRLRAYKHLDWQDAQLDAMQTLYRQLQRGRHGLRRSDAAAIP